MTTTVVTVTAGQKADGRADVAFAVQIKTTDGTGAFPPNGYISSVEFDGDNGHYNLSGAAATKSVDTTGGNHYKTWTWAVAQLPFATNPFTAATDYAVTINTVTIPPVVDLDIAAAKAAILGGGFTLGTVTYGFSSTPGGQVSAQTPVGDTPASPGDPVDIVVSLGPQPGVIYKLIQKLLLSLHKVFDKDPHQQLALRLQYNGGLTWTIANAVLTTTVTGGTGVNLSIPLFNLSIADLAALLDALPGYSVPFVDGSQYAQLSALVLIDSSNSISTSNGDHIYGYTNPLWSYLDPIGAELGAAQAQIPNMLAQMVVPTAEDEWLDEQGSYYKVPRDAGETDPSYSPRIVTSVLQPKGNNVAIAMAIQALAPAATRVRVIDALDDLLFAILYNGEFTYNGSIFFDAGLGPNSGYGFFDVDFSYDFLGDITQDQYLTIIESTVEKFRDAGTQLRGIVFRNLNSTTLIVSDSFVGNVRVIVYDDFGASSYRLLENGLVRLLETGDARLLE